MTVYIGNAVHDENEKAKGGQPGDQTGKEVVVQAWYKNSKGWRVLRAKDGTAARKIAEAMRNACANDAIGYDQGDRNTLYTEAAKIGFDPGRVSVPCETDCSALVRVCLAYAGIKVSFFNTANEAAVLLATGKFTELTGTEYTDTPDRLREGDVLITKAKGHTAIVLNNGERVDPRPEPVPEPKYVEVVGRRVRVRSSDSVLGKTVRIVRQGDKLDYIGTAPSGWYEVEDGFITNKPKYTRLV